MFSVLSYLTHRFFKRSSNESINKPKFVGTPLFNVLLMVSLMLAVSAFFKFLEWRRLSAHTQIQFADSVDSPGEKDAGKPTALNQAEIFGGEVFDTSIRLRETGAFGFAVCLSLVDEAHQKREIPGSINGLLNTVITRGLLPPGLTVKNGEISSQTSKIYVRYKLEPMQLEFVSLPADARFGPALMLRFPLSSADGKNIAYFQSSSVSNINLLPPFAPAHEVIKSGWTLESWRGMEITGNRDFARMLAEEQEKLKTIAPVEAR